MSTYKHICQPFEPVFDKDSRILILGSLPSVVSREQGFYYGHPRNRFWRLISAVVNKPEPESIEEKKELLHGSHIAVWDVIKECDIIGSSDQSIKNAVAADIRPLLDHTKIKAVFLNGAAAGRLYERFIMPQADICAVKLPSTSPANAAWSFDRLFEKWRSEISGYLK